MTRLSNADLKRLGVADEDLPAKESKYHNVPTEVDGYMFDSAKEARRFQELQLAQKAGQISGLIWDKKRLRFPLRVNGRLICTYEADFAYWERDEQTGVFSGGLVVEDCKGVRTPAYLLKKKLMKALRDIDILET